MRTILALGLGAALCLAACGNAASPAPSESASLAPTTAPTPVESPSAIVTTDAEAQLLANVRSDIQPTCAPLRADLPKAAVAAISCTPDSDVAASLTVSGFASQKAMLAAYKAWVKAHGIKIRSHQGACLAKKASEGAYIPGDTGTKLTPNRSACFVDADGHAHYVATAPNGLIEVVGKGGKIPALEDWAWLGSQDAPGVPTVWGANGQFTVEG